MNFLHCVTIACSLEFVAAVVFIPFFSRGRTTPMRNDTRAQSCAEILHIVWREILRVLWRKIFHIEWREISQLLWVILCILWGIISSGTLWSHKVRKLRDKWEHPARGELYRLPASRSCFQEQVIWESWRACQFWLWKNLNAQSATITWFGNQMICTFFKKTVSWQHTTNKTVHSKW